MAYDWVLRCRCPCPAIRRTTFFYDGDESAPNFFPLIDVKENPRTNKMNEQTNKNKKKNNFQIFIQYTNTIMTLLCSITHKERREKVERKYAHI